MRARYSKEARQEFLAQLSYYAAGNPRSAVQFRQAIEAAVNRAVEFPNAGTPLRHQVRRVLVRRFPFSVIYRLEGDEIVVYAVAHHAREPGYWESRIDP
jgi:toxin ParE1/3/4